MKPAVTDVLDPADFKVDPERNTLVGYFDAKNNDAYKIFEQVADELFESVDFLACLGDGFKERPAGETVMYKPKKISGESDSVYSESLTDIGALQKFVNEKANPLVREITFENGEELTEEGLPFLILFHKPDDVTAIQRFKNAVMRELLPERGNINFLTADGTTFSHPLHHLGKSINDLPLISIDSFRHMYLFKNFENVDVPGKLKQFIADLHSGKLHTDFHNPPPEEESVQEIPHVDAEIPPAPATEAPPVEVADGVTREPVVDKIKAPKAESGSGSETEEDKEVANPPDTIFQKLAPSENRYTLLHWRDYAGNYRDEL